MLILPSSPPSLLPTLFASVGSPLPRPNLAIIDHLPVHDWINTHNTKKYRITDTRFQATTKTQPPSGALLRAVGPASPGTDSPPATHHATVAPAAAPAAALAEAETVAPLAEEPLPPLPLATVFGRARTHRLPSFSRHRLFARRWQKQEQERRRRRQRPLTALRPPTLGAGGAAAAAVLTAEDPVATGIEPAAVKAMRGAAAGGVSRGRE